MGKYLVTLVAIVLLAAACGSDDDLGSVGGAETSTDGSETPADGDQPAGDADGSTSGDSGSDWCDAVRTAATEEGSPLDFDLLGLTPEELEARFTENVAVLERWEAQAPPEIASQVTTLVDAFRTVVTLADEAGWDLVTLGTDPGFVEAFDTAELEAAADDIDAYSRDVCGVDLGVTTADAGGATTPSVPAPGSADAVSEFLETFGLPANFLDDDQLACVTAELEAAFPDGPPAELTLNAETVQLFDTVGSTCGIGIP